MKYLLMLAIAIIIAQSIIIVKLVNKINKKSLKIKSEREISKNFINTLIKMLLNSNNDLKDYKDAYEKCHKQYSIKFIESKNLKQQLRIKNKDYDNLLESHISLSSKLFNLIKEGRVIKSKYQDKFLFYNFNEMTKDEIIDLFGTNILQQK